MLCQKLIFIHPFLSPRGDKSIAIVTPKKTANMPKKIKVFILLFFYNGVDVAEVSAFLVII